MRRCKAALFGAASLSCGVGRALSAPAATPPPACDSSGRKKCVVVGAGVVGLSTAYFLWKSGQYEIQVIEQRDACAQGASFQNGGSDSDIPSP
jgi:NADPH-dependent 2,4-dienoyl-CoA reductase/sulfur reductase-like enzyme